MLPQRLAAFLAGSLFVFCLSVMADSRVADTHAFNWQRGFHGIIDIHIFRITDDQWMLKATNTPRKRSKDSIQTAERLLEKSDIASIDDKADACQFADMDPALNKVGYDGGYWKILITSQDKSHTVERWSPDDTCFRELGLLFVKLAGFNVKPDEIY